jgi:hypothetical protein
MGTHGAAGLRNVLSHCTIEAISMPWLRFASIDVGLGRAMNDPFGGGFRKYPLGGTWFR